MWNPTVWLDRCDSTQSILKKNQVPYFTVVATGYQDAGYGRQKAAWLSQPNKNLLFSFQRPFQEKERSWLWLSVLCSTLKLVQAQGIDVWIKPPNDLYVGRKKLAGILVEAHALPERHATIGVGLNVLQTQFNQDLMATSLMHEKPQDYDLMQLLTSWQSIYQATVTQSHESQISLYTNHIRVESLDIFENGCLLEQVEWLNDGSMVSQGRRLNPNHLVYKLKP